VIAPVLLCVCLFLLPWTFWLTQTLPRRHVSEHWRVAWTGFDVALAVLFALTALAVLRRAAWLQGAASATAMLLLADVWFDTLLSSHPRIAIFEAVFSELPLALLLLWIAHDTARFWRRWLRVLEIAPPKPRAADEGTPERRLRKEAR
jgi:hypothetical protein